MSPIPTISLTLLPGLRTNGDVVSGTVNLNLRLAKQKDVQVVSVSLSASMETYLYARTSNRDYREDISLLSQLKPKVLWTPSTTLPTPPDIPQEIAHLPFSFTLPDRHELPPSFASHSSNGGACVRYHVDVLAVRKWPPLPWNPHIHISQDIPFLPIDDSPVSYMSLHNWSGEWRSFRESRKVRRGVISRHGIIHVDFRIPALPTIPLFRPVPIKLRITCLSKPLSSSTKRDPSTFDFPRVPKIADCKLVLRLVGELTVGKVTHDFKQCLGRHGGFGKPPSPSSKKIKQMRQMWDGYAAEAAGDDAAWGDKIQVETGPPHWVVDKHDRSTGYWREEAVYSSVIVFRCVPRFSTRLIKTNPYLRLHVGLPGIFNSIVLNTGPLRLSSGIVRPGTSTSTSTSARASARASSQILPTGQPPQLQVIIPYLEYHNSEEYMDLLPSYNDAIEERDGFT